MWCLCDLRGIAGAPQSHGGRRRITIVFVTQWIHEPTKLLWRPAVPVLIPVLGGGRNDKFRLYRPTQYKILNYNSDHRSDAPTLDHKKRPSTTTWLMHYNSDTNRALLRSVDSTPNLKTLSYFFQVRNRFLGQLPKSWEEIGVPLLWLHWV